MSSKAKMVLAAVTVAMAAWITPLSDSSAHDYYPGFAARYYGGYVPVYPRYYGPRGYYSGPGYLSGPGYYVPRIYRGPRIYAPGYFGTPYRSPLMSDRPGGR